MNNLEELAEIVRQVMNLQNMDRMHISTDGGKTYYNAADSLQTVLTYIENQRRII